MQRFHVVLKPQRAERVRLLVVGRKRLPDVAQHERFWGFVDRLADSAAALEPDLRAVEYATQSRGERHLPAVRPAAEGVYAIGLLDGRMRLSYVLELPKHPGEVQRAFKIAPEASFILAIKNPEAGSPPGSALSDEQKPGLAEAEDYDHAEIIRELHMVKSRHPVRPLFEGKWERARAWRLADPQPLA